jgi:hypothetical protein
MSDATQDSTVKVTYFRASGKCEIRGLYGVITIHAVPGEHTFQELECYYKAMMGLSLRQMAELVHGV